MVKMNSLPNSRTLGVGSGGTTSAQAQIGGGSVLTEL